jgi:hypothetical protein
LLFLDLFLMTILVLTSSIRSSCGNGSRIFWMIFGSFPSLLVPSL